jgi:glycosyltransferase involved in cell wall biosynthesis
MVIAVNARFLLPGYLEGYGNFVLECFSRLAAAHPEHQFVYIFDRPFESRFLTAPNIVPVVAGPPARHPLLWRFWFNYRIPALLRRYKADVFVSADGFCSLRTAVPQCLVVHDLAFLQYPDFIARSHARFYKKMTSAFLQKATCIATVSAFSKQDICTRYGLAAERVHCIGNGVKPVFRPIDLPEKERVKAQYSEGKDYFICVGAIHPRKNGLNLLKAFSLFKKRQKSNMQLLFVGRMGWHTDAFTKQLETYKYRADVRVLGYVPDEELNSLIGAAYALVYPSFFEGFGVPVLEGMRCDTPVITSSVGCLPEIGGTAALYADPHQPEAIAEQMMRLFKDENLREELIHKGRIQAASYTWESTADALWQLILQAVKS